jgi:hypothetical protein
VISNRFARKCFLKSGFSLGGNRGNFSLRQIPPGLLLGRKTPFWGADKGGFLCGLSSPEGKAGVRFPLFWETWEFFPFSGFHWFAWNFGSGEIGGDNFPCRGVRGEFRGVSH